MISTKEKRDFVLAALDPKTPYYSGAVKAISNMDDAELTRNFESISSRNPMTCMVMGAGPIDGDTGYEVVFIGEDQHFVIQG